jgi:hypothetical protein
LDWLWCGSRDGFLIPKSKIQNPKSDRRGDVMMPAQSAIARFQRDVVVARLLNVLLLLGVALCFFFGAAVDSRFADVLLVLLIGVIWVTLGVQSMKGTRLAANSPSLIAAGEFDQAEHQIEQALRSFSLFRSSKILSLHHLAVLRHAQRRWPDAAELSRAVLGQRLGTLSRLSRQSRLILADSMLELGDLRTAHAAIAELYKERLSLPEALSLLGVQLDYLWRIHAWERMLEGIATKIQLAELMPTPASAKAQALLALAARKLGRTELSDYLRRRVELLVDVDELIRARPVLHELYRVATPKPDATPTISEPDASGPQPPL